jgi:hypothetical protein
MGTLYKVTCSNCSHVGELSWGDGIFHLQFQCNECLKLFNIPRKAPRTNRNGREVPKFLEKQDFKTTPPIPLEGIIRFTDDNLRSYLASRSDWQHGDDEWDDYEIEQLISLVSCECDDDVTKVSDQKQLKLSCTKCGSSNIECIKTGTSD